MCQFRNATANQQSAYFDGQYLLASNSISYGTATTIEFWARLDLATTYGYPLPNARTAVSHGANNGPILAVDSDEIRAGGYGVPFLDTSGITVGSWHHIAYVSSASSSRLYIDGVLADDSSGGLTGGVLHVGAENPTQHFYVGYLDELRISDVERYATNFTPAGRHEPDGSTLALYHFDGDTLDASANGNHLTGSVAFFSDENSGD